MTTYVPHTDTDKKLMLDKIGVSALEELFRDIPQQLRKAQLSLPEGLSTMEALEKMEALAGENRVFRSILRGAGAYDHYIPPVVRHLTGRPEFVTAYTPYQAEMSQGILQAIFEYQSMICSLTGMDVANASVYDGATAAAEAIMMCFDKKRTKVLLSENINPETLAVIQTYCRPHHLDVILVPSQNGVLDLAALSSLVDATTACVYLENPNYWGCLEDAEEIGKVAHEAGAKFIMGCNPISLALLKTPCQYGADIVVGEGQPLGMPLSFGGPYLGFMAATTKEMRRLPGRIVGETTDAQGQRAYVLTLQAREQHIRREKASSNICSNQALCALTAAVYLASVGPVGLREVATACVSMAHYAAAEFTKIPGVSLKYPGEFFHEFVTTISAKTADVLAKLEERGILGGLPVSEHEILWCMTEKVKREDILTVCEVLRSVK
ncbi:MAG: aminomethyl-transferring glycine dehydrogenase subunit GcvPA [Planctomycetia bacterium]|nr:aminomethyl-transferring glycine dehydrogenase subunit GcvPA [Planctomycetia bacterium]